MDPELLALLMGQQAVPMSTASDMPGSYQPQPYGNYGGTTQDPIEALKAQIFAPPPEQQTDVKYRDLGRGGKIGLILNALGDVANVVQRQSARGARTFAPSRYTQQFLAGEHQKLAEKNALSSRADQLKRAKMLHELDVMEKAAAERRQIAREALHRAFQEADGLTQQREVASRAGVVGAQNMNDAQLMQGMQQKAAEEDAAKKAQQDRQYWLQVQEHADALSARDQARQDRLDSQAGVNNVEQRGIAREQRIAVKDVRSKVIDSRNILMDKLASGPTDPATATEEYSRLKRQLQAHAEAQGLDAAGMDEVDQLFEKEIGDLIRSEVQRAMIPPDRPPDIPYRQPMNMRVPR